MFSLQVVEVAAQIQGEMSESGDPNDFFNIQGFNVLDEDQGYAYVCAVRLLPNTFPAGSDNGYYGYLYIKIQDAPFCGGGGEQTGFVFSIGATDSKSDSDFLYDSRSINSIFQVASRAAAHGQEIFWRRCADDKPYCFSTISFRAAGVE
tara:strand:+ start:1387 stop:1833 length:447 start_codon:yes stop_codon:yes gene_type:complete